MPQAIDLTGKTFGKLTPLRAITTGRLRSWVCRCACGQETCVPTNKITSGHTQSCGCIKEYTTRTNGHKNLVHGQSHAKSNPTYRTWTAMRQRCRVGHKGKEAYWKRGITVCARWQEFLNFHADMGDRPVGTTLDRIDVNGNYEPGNCRWASAKQQQRNLRTTNYLVIDGRSIPAMDVADALGLKKSAMSYFLTVSKKLKAHYGLVPTVEGGLPMDR